MDFPRILPAPIKINEISHRVSGQASFVSNFSERFLENGNAAAVPVTGLCHAGMRRGRGRPVDNYCMKVVVLQAGYLKRPNSWKELQQLKEAGLGTLDYGKLQVRPNIDEEEFRQFLVTVCPVLRGHSFSFCKASSSGDLIALAGINTPSGLKKAVKRGTLYILPHSVVQTTLPSLSYGMEMYADTIGRLSPDTAVKNQHVISVKQECGAALGRSSEEDIISVKSPVRLCGSLGNISAEAMEEVDVSCSFVKQERSEGTTASQGIERPMPSNIFLPTKFDVECEDFSTGTVGDANPVTRKEDASSVRFEVQEENYGVEEGNINKTGLLLTESNAVHRCTICEATFNHKDQLSDHNISRTGVKQFRCRKFFHTKAVRKHHARIQAGARPYKCNTCSFTSRQKARLVMHNRLHRNMKPYICTECDQSFCFQRSFVAHMQVHAGEKSYTCTVCTKTFAAEQDLMAHVTVHTRYAPFECHECGAAFRTKYNLTIHMRIHFDDQPYKCKLCGWAFHQKSYLMAHSQRHGNEKPYKCSECDRNFRHRQALVKHKEWHVQQLGHELEADKTIKQL